MLWSFGKVLVFAAVIILVHCYHGFHATGGPAGVGLAVGRAIQTSIVALSVMDFFMSFAIWGSTHHGADHRMRQPPLARDPRPRRCACAPAAWCWLVLLALLVALSVATYNKAFDGHVTVHRRRPRAPACSSTSAATSG